MSLGPTSSRRSSGGRNDSPLPMSPSRTNSHQGKRPVSKKKRIIKMTSSGNFNDTKFFEEIRARDRSASLDRIPEDHKLAIPEDQKEKLTSSPNPLREKIPFHAK